MAALVAAYGFYSQSLAFEAAGALGAVTVCAIGGYIDNWSWTGFGPFTTPSTGNTNVQRGKTLWDVLQLVVLPAVLTFGVVWFNSRQAVADKVKIQEQARDTVLDDYLSQVSTLMLKNSLGLKAGDDVRAIARARTLTALTRLDPERRSNVVRFLSESSLIPVVDLSVANLVGVSLQGFDLSCIHRLANHRFCADLSYGWLTRGDLSYTNMVDVDLTRAHLSHANLAYANFFCVRLTSADRPCSPRSRAWLHGADLSSTDLSHANLAYVDLSAANLAHADLSHANLAHANLSHARSLDVHWDHTVCPDSTNSATNHTSPETCPHG